VGIDLHPRRSVIYRTDRAGEKIDSVGVDNEPNHFAKEISATPVGRDVILEATHGWYWAADLLADMGYQAHLPHPHGNDWGHGRVKTTSAMPAIWRICFDSVDSPRPGSPRQRPESRMIRFRMMRCNPAHRSEGSSPRSQSWPRTESCPAATTCGVRASVSDSTGSSIPML
jgi:hypothetical protein